MSRAADPLAAALAYAGWEWPVFPLHEAEHRPDGAWCTCGKRAGKGPGECDRAGKHPRIEHGLNEASTDTDTVRAWWKRWPGANIGVRTGIAPVGAGVWVLDLDLPKPGHVGLTALEYLEAAAVNTGDTAGEWRRTRTAQTGGGGLHLFYRYGPELAAWLDGIRMDGTSNRYTLRNRAGVDDVSGLDTRGDGGYIVAAPGSHASGGRYTWENIGEVRDAPEWLLRLVARPVPAAGPYTPPPGRGETDRERAWVSTALTGICMELAATQEGARNDRLNAASYRIGGYVGAGLIDAAHAENELCAAGLASGLSPGEVSDTVRRALAAGALHPIRPVLEDRRDDYRGGPMPDCDDYRDNAPPPSDDDAPHAEGPDVRQAKDFTEPDDLARWHVKAVLDAMLDPNRPKPAPIAPLPGGYGADRSREIRNDAELLADPFTDVGWPDLTRLIDGWRPDTVAVLVGHTGRGKSSIAVQSAEAAAKAGAPVLYASLEMSAEELACRLLSLRGRPGAAWVGVKRRQYSPEAIRRAADRLIAECPHLYLWAPDSQGRNVEALSRMAAAVSAAGGGGAPLVVLDYVQRCAPAEAEDRRMAVSDLSGRLRDLSRPGSLSPEWPGAAVLALSSTGRHNYKSFDNTAALRMGADLEGSGKESGELEYDAPILLCMTSDLPGEGESDPYEGRMALVRVVKNREGMPGTAWLRFEAARGRFTHTTAPPLPEKAEKGPAGPNEYQRTLSLKAADDKKSKAVLAADGARDKALLAAGDDQAKQAKAHAAHALAVEQARKLRALESAQANERQDLRSTSKQDTKANRSEGRF